MDEVIALYKRHLDRTLLRENLRRTPQERLVHLQRWGETIGALRGEVPHGPGLGALFRSLIGARVEFVLCGETAAAALGVDDCVMRLDLACPACDVDEIVRALAPFNPRRRSLPTKVQTDLAAVDLWPHRAEDYGHLRANRFPLHAYGLELYCLRREPLLEMLRASASPRDLVLVDALEGIAKLRSDC